jgi:hypothetical protein
MSQAATSSGSSLAEIVSPVSALPLGQRADIARNAERHRPQS